LKGIFHECWPFKAAGAPALLGQTEKLYFDLVKVKNTNNKKYGL